MIILDTNALLWTALSPGKLSRRAASAIRRDREHLVPSICFWEIASLVRESRVRLPAPVLHFLRETSAADRVRVVEISPEIAFQAAHLAMNRSIDPADQLVAATALVLHAPLVTSDERLQAIPGLRIIW